MSDTPNSRAVIVGGTSGLGLGIAREFLKHDARVTVGSRDQEKLSKAVSTLGSGALGFPVDVTSDASLAEFFRNTGPFQHLVITASAAIADRPFGETSVAEFGQFAATKLWGTVRCLQIALKAEIAPGASITLVSGAVSKKGRSGSHAKAMINSALEGLTRSLAVELGGHVRVNCISPAAFDSKGSMPASRMDELKKMYPTGYVGSSADVAALVYALAVNPFLTGSVVYADGGWTAT